MTTLEKITVYRGHMSSSGSQLDVVASTDDIDSVNDLVDKAIDMEVKFMQSKNPNFKSYYLRMSFHRDKQKLSSTMEVIQDLSISALKTFVAMTNILIKDIVK